MTEAKLMHPLSVVHLVAIFGLLVWWSAYFWSHSPVREMFEQDAAGAARHPALRGCLASRARGIIDTTTTKVGAAIELTLADVASGLSVLVAFGVATGIYIRRLEIWLQVRASGETIALASAGLADQAVAANAGRQKARP